MLIIKRHFLTHFALLSSLVVACSLAMLQESAPPTSSWAQLAADDIEAIYEQMRDNHPGILNEEDPTFTNRLEKVKEQALAKATEVQNFEGYTHAMRYCATLFQDPHVRVTPLTHRNTIQWPGIKIKHKDGNFFVSHVSDAFDYPEQLKIGARLVACDGVAVRKRLLRDIFPYNKGIPGLEAWEHFIAPKLLLDEGNPWVKRTAECVFEDEKKHQFTVPLSWKDTTLGEWQGIAQPAIDNQTEPIYLRHLDNGGIWIRLKTFSPYNKQLIEVMRNVIDQASQIRNAPFVVFDIRGNGGGSYIWGDRLLSSLFGSEWRDHAQKNNATGKGMLKRCSPANIAGLSCMIDSIKDIMGTSSREYAMIQHYLSNLGKNSAAATDHNKLLHEEDLGKIVAQWWPENEQPAEVNATIFVVTDYHAMSASLYFMDSILSIPDVIHVGLPTLGDTPYTDLRFATLPSGIMELSIPTGINCNMPQNRRGWNQAYTPRYRYDGDINDTAELQKWVTDLYKSNTSKSID